MNSCEIEKRFENEVFACQLMYQFISDLFVEKNNYFLNIGLNFYNPMYIAMIDSLIMRVIKLFDPEKSCGKENFSLPFIETAIDEFEIDYDGSSDSLKHIKEYRIKFLAHLDLNADKIDFKSYKAYLKDINVLIDVLFRNLNKIAKINNHHNIWREVLPADNGYNSFLQVVNVGAFVVSNRQDNEVYKNIIKESKTWAEEQQKVKHE